MSKGAVDEDLPNFGGAYGGAGTHPEVKRPVEDADVVLFLGRYPVSLIGYLPGLRKTN